VSEVGQHVKAEPGQAHLEHRAIERHGDGWEQIRNAVGSADRWDRGLRSFANLLNTPAAVQPPLRGSCAALCLLALTFRPGKIVAWNV
jgi:hypothetical protein